MLFPTLKRGQKSALLQRLHWRILKTKKQRHFLMLYFVRIVGGELSIEYLGCAAWDLGCLDDAERVTQRKNVGTRKNANAAVLSMMPRISYALVVASTWRLG